MRFPIGYAYEADLHCCSCTEERFGSLFEARAVETVVDREGNQVTPIYSWDEFDSDPHCGDCREPLR